MDSLVVGNLVSRPTRTLGSVLGIALGVILVVVTTGLARGMLRATGERESNIGAELIFQSSGSFGAGAVPTALSLPVAYAEAIAQIDGVAAATPVGRYLRSGSQGIGFELIEGVVFEEDDELTSYPEVTGIRIVEGRPPSGDRELAIDRQRAMDSGLAPGETLELLGDEFTVAGVFEPEVGARIKMRLQTLQELLGTPDKCSWVLVKGDSASQQDSLAQSINDKFPGNQIIFTRDIPSMYERGMPSLNVFLDVVVTLSAIISVLVILLAVYTSVTERTREIGILRSLGASKTFIMLEVLKEALLLATLGLVVGVAGALATRVFIARFTSLEVALQLEWVLIATLVVYAASVIGSIYPAFKAARQDPIAALAYE